MSEAAIALAALFALSMIGLGLALFVKGAREHAENRRGLPNWARRRELG